MNTSHVLPTLPAYLEKIAVLFGLVEDQAAERDRASEIQRKEDENLIAEQAAERAQEKDRLQRQANEAQAEKDRAQAEADERKSRAEAAQAEADKLV